MKKNLVSDTSDCTANGVQQEQSSLRKPRGFAAMDPARQREIASLGGLTAHRNGTAHEFTTEEARAAGRLSRKKK